MKLRIRILGMGMVINPINPESDSYLDNHPFKGLITLYAH